MLATISSLKSCIKKHWKKITPEFLKPYFDGMNGMMQEVIEKQGDKINY